MKTGVIYLFHPHKKINGTLFYCFEYYALLKKHIDVDFYIIGISDNDLADVTKLLSEKYTFPVNIIPIKNYTDVYSLKLDRTLILDVKTFYKIKEFLTNDVHVFSNEKHEMFRYTNERTVTYYGSYSEYQDYDVFNYLKLNFGIVKIPKKKGNAVFIACPNPGHININLENYKGEFKRPIILKSDASGVGNLYERIDHIHYVHTQLDTNNRTIPEAFFFNIGISIDNYVDIEDSITLRYNDIKENGLGNYTLTLEDEMIKACLK